MKKIFIGIIGLGVGMHHYKFLKSKKNCEIIAVCDFNINKLNKIKNNKIFKTQNSNELINYNKINTIIISSFDNFHYEQIIKSINKKFHIFIEKPICQNKTQLKNIYKLLDNNKSLAFYSNFNLRFAPEFVKLKNEIINKNFGKIYYIEASYNYSRLFKLNKGWRGSSSFYSINQGGAIHMLDLVLFLINLKFKKIICFGNKIATKNSTYKFNDFSVGLVKFFNSSIILKISSNFGSNGPHNHGLKIFGTKKTFIQDYPNIKTFQGDDRSYIYKSKIIPKDKSYKLNTLSYFINLIQNKKNILYERKLLFETMNAIFAMDKSMNKNKDNL